MSKTQQITWIKKYVTFEFRDCGIIKYIPDLLVHLVSIYFCTIFDWVPSLRFADNEQKIYAQIHLPKERYADTYTYKLKAFQTDTTFKFDEFTFKVYAGLEEVTYCKIRDIHSEWSDIGGIDIHLQWSDIAPPIPLFKIFFHIAVIDGPHECEKALFNIKVTFSESSYDWSEVLAVRYPYQNNLFKRTNIAYIPQLNNQQSYDIHFFFKPELIWFNVKHEFLDPGPFRFIKDISRMRHHVSFTKDLSSALNCFRPEQESCQSLLIYQCYLDDRKWSISVYNEDNYGGFKLTINMLHLPINLEKIVTKLKFEIVMNSKESKQLKPEGGYGFWHFINSDEWGQYLSITTRFSIFDENVVKYGKIELNGNIQVREVIFAGGRKVREIELYNTHPEFIVDLESEN